MTDTEAERLDVLSAFRSKLGGQVPFQILVLGRITDWFPVRLARNPGEAMISTRPHVPHSQVKAVSVVPVDIAGPMGRGYLMLPCKHHRANFPDPYHVTRPQVRKCSTCGIRYQITFRLPDASDASDETTAQVTRLS